MLRKAIFLSVSCLTILVSVATAAWGANELFQAPRSFPSEGTQAAAIAVADVNGDGILDLIVADSCFRGGNDCYGGVGVLLGNGDGTYQPVTTYDSGGRFAAAVAVGDVNGDGKPDLVVTSRCADLYCYYGGVVGVLLGNGNGTFQPPLTYYSGGSWAQAVALADVNHDGKLDVLVAHAYYYGIGVLLGNGDGTLQPAQSYGPFADEAKAIAAADVNEDGNLDLVVTYQYYKIGAKYFGGVGILVGKGDGTFQPGPIYYSGGKLADSTVVADVNGDGRLDLLVANECAAEGCGHGGVASVLLGNGDGTFQAPQVYKSGGYKTTSIAFGDVDGDGHGDLILANGNTALGGSKKGVSVLLGNGDGTFRAAETYNSGGDAANVVALADVNGDDKLDVVVANGCYAACGDGGLVSVLLRKIATTTELDSELNPSYYGQPVTFVAKVTSSGGATPAGTVSFSNGGKLMGKATLSGGVARFIAKNLKAGSFSIAAAYSGDPETMTSKSAPLNQVVQQAVTTTKITSSVNPSAQGQLVKFTATVTSPTRSVTGTVTFTADSTILGTVTLVGSKATLTTSALPQGSSTITAAYDGTADIAKSSASLIQTVN